ncbi:IPT/TIG domain-containing protein [Pilimelia terevasa]|uniref:IPT/TIG domain-containing protein n=1 Tax=Pilimelia terevasa TaxID=53372 RepID=UPI00166BBDA9|nr:IPT/TIG domain-containing protein [Pilimelia terevasa]
MSRPGLAIGAAALLVVGLSAPAMAASVPMTLSAPSGPSQGGNTLTGTTTTAVFNANSAVEFQYVGTGAAAACSAVYAAPAAVVVAGTPPVQTAGILAVPAANVRLLSTTKLGITVPATVALAGGQTTAKYNVCVYSGTVTGASGSPLIANAAYSIAAKPVISAISPSTGPALGGKTVTITGSNFPTTAGALTASIGGTALTGISVAANGNSFTANLPAKTAGGPYTLSVTSAGGTVTKANAFTYTNGIVVVPNTAPNTGATLPDIDIQGVGFTNLDFSMTTGATPNDAKSHVYLVDGKYDPTTNSGNKTIGEVAECINVLVVSDTEVICSMNLRSRISTTGTYTTVAARTVADGATTNASTTLTSATAAFTSADVGMSLSVASNTQVPAGTTIVSVTNPTTVVLSAAATATATGVSTTIGPRTAASVTTVNASTGVTAAAPQFTVADVGRSITGTGIPAGTVISAYTSATQVTLSNAATAGGTVTMTIANPVPVPNGTYTVAVISNGAVDVQAGGASEDANYTESIISSGSTFTVADY